MDTPVIHPNQQDSTAMQQARAAYTRLSRAASATHGLNLEVVSAEEPEPIALPAEAVAPILAILNAIASGQTVTVMADDTELTTAQAADVLHVSRPYLIQLLETGAIPYRKVGTHRRIRLQDVLAYKRAIDKQREAVLDQLVAEAQELGMGYD